MRTLIGFLWFLAFLILPAIAAAVIVPSLGHVHGDQAFEAGRVLGRTFGLPLGILAAVVAVVGTKRGFLPGTARR